MKKTTVFKDVIITDHDRDRLFPILRSLTSLNEAMVLGALDTEDTKKLIHLESFFKQRRDIMKRLIGRYTKLHRNDLYAALGIDDE